jgi:hypothetical protein
MSFKQCFRQNSLKLFSPKSFICSIRIRVLVCVGFKALNVQTFKQSVLRHLFSQYSCRSWGFIDYNCINLCYYAVGQTMPQNNSCAREFSLNEGDIFHCPWEQRRCHYPMGHTVPLTL